MSETFISVDIEASGPIIGTHSMLQIGACLVDEPGVTYQVILKPISEAFDPKAMEIVGKSMSYFFEHGRDATGAMSDLAEWVSKHSKEASPIFVGFNAAFDWGFINWYFLTTQGANPFGVSPLDIKAYYAGLSGCAWDETRSSRLPARFKSSRQHTHDALADAVEQAEMFRLMRDSR